MQLYSVAVFGAQYRLGIFGFLALQELIEEVPKRHTGNHGLLDQRGLLAWLNGRYYTNRKSHAGAAQERLKVMPLDMELSECRIRYIGKQEKSP